MEPGMSSGSKRPMQPDELTQYDQNLIKRMTSSQEGTSKQPEGKTESLEENMDTLKMKCIHLEKLCAELQTGKQLLLTEFQAQSFQNAMLQANLAERIESNRQTESQRDENLELLEISMLTLTPVLDELRARKAQNRWLEFRVQSLTWQLLEQERDMHDQERVFVLWKIHHNQQMEEKERELQQLQQQLAGMQLLDEDEDQDVDEEDSAPSTHTPSESESETDTEFNSGTPVAGEGQTRAPSTHIPSESETEEEFNPVSPVAGEGPTRAPSTHTPSESETEEEFNSGSPVAGEGPTKDRHGGV